MRLNWSFNLVSASLHLSWFSFVSNIQASAIARAGVLSGGGGASRPRRVAFLFCGDDGESKVIYNRGSESTGAERKAHKKVALPYHPRSLEVLSADSFGSICL